MRRFGVALALVLAASTYAGASSATTICAVADGADGGCDGGTDDGGTDASVLDASAILDASNDTAASEDATSPATTPTSTSTIAPPALSFQPVNVNRPGSPTFDDDSCSAGGARSPWSPLAAIGITVVALASLRRTRRAR
jgi:hypothetical protein